MKNKTDSTNQTREKLERFEPEPTEARRHKTKENKMSIVINKQPLQEQDTKKNDILSKSGKITGQRINFTGGDLANKAFAYCEQVGKKATPVASLRFYLQNTTDKSRRQINDLINRTLDQEGDLNEVKAVFFAKKMSLQGKICTYAEDKKTGRSGLYFERRAPETKTAKAKRLQETKEKDYSDQLAAHGLTIVNGQVVKIKEVEAIEVKAETVAEKTIQVPRV